MVLSVAGNENQYKRNKVFLSQLTTSGNPEHNWIITVAFYTALHLVEQNLKNKGFCATNHIKRNNLVGTKLREIRGEYKSLYDKSRESRYDCFTFGKVDSDWALNQLKIIESKLGA
ncbi:hypothetical protein [Bacillus rhizoplanae]|uniref:hypothetical protein n=1 Tax=Bacillus rhizoplanae TaxID=2880966 RepID=UPI003D2405A9